MIIEDLGFEVKKLSLSPGDILVLSTSDVLSMNAHNELKAYTESALNNNKVMVLEQGMRLEGVVSGQWTRELPERAGYYWLWNHIKEDIEIVLVLESEDGMMVRYLEPETWREPLQFLPAAGDGYWWLRVEAPAPPAKQ